MPTQMVQTRLASTIREIGHAGDREAVHAANVNHPRGVSCGRGRGFFEEGREELGEGENALQVEGQEFRPGVVGVLVKGLAPGGARVVDEDVEPGGLEGGEARREGFACVEGLDVCGQGDGGAAGGLAWDER